MFRGRKRRKKKYDGALVFCPKCCRDVKFGRTPNLFGRHDFDGNDIPSGLLKSESECQNSGAEIPKEAVIFSPMSVSFA